jgi:hydrogenase maturation protease
MEDKVPDRQRSILVIGYGNPLRGDDALGPHLVEKIAALQLPMVRTKAVHQLLPELAAEIAKYACVIFIDAHRGPLPDGVLITSLEPSGSPVNFSHRVDAEGLLALTQDLYGREPSALFIQVVGENFEMHEGLSEAATMNAEEALRRIAEVVHAMERK